MTSMLINRTSSDPMARWLKSYYFTRFAFSAAWVVLAVTLASHSPPLAAIMLVGYPAWDAVANLLDARRSGGVTRNSTQLFNFFVSVITAAAVGVALTNSISSVVLIFGLWAGLAGLLQLATAVRRWRSYGAQWPMILSGVQSMLAAAFIVKMAQGPDPLGIVTIAPYAAFGAFYFLLSAIWLTFREARKGNRT